jgi:hypothetical protein
VQHSGTIAPAHEDAADATFNDQEVLRDYVLLESHVFRPTDGGAQGAADFSASAIAVRVQDAAATVRRLAP